jgi:hypothetical protein
LSDYRDAEAASPAKAKLALAKARNPAVKLAGTGQEAER